MLNGAKILVTGGAGFIGSHLVEKLVEMHNYVIVYDNFDNYYIGKKKNIEHLIHHDCFALIEADILDYETLLNAEKHVDMVFHLAAQPGVRFSMENPNKTTNVNIMGTFNVLKASKKSGVKKVIFASSSSVYGQSKKLPIDEGHPTEPISIYGTSKLAAEKCCQIFSFQLNLPVTMLRYHTVYGPRQRPDMAIHKWTKAIFENKPITIYGDGAQTRDFTFISDIINGTIKAAEAEDIGGEIFNLGGGSKNSVNDTVQMLIETTEIDDIQTVHEPPKLGDVSDTHADITKARKMIDFNPKVHLKDGLKSFVGWYRNHKLSG